MPQFTPTGPFSRQTWKAVENAPGQLLGQLGQLGGYLGSYQAAKDYAGLLQGRLPAIGRPAAAQFGPPVPAKLIERSGGGAPPAPILPPAGSRTPITSPNTIFQNADEEYKTLLSQYGGAPGISQLAGMASLPTGFTPAGATKQANLKDYYAAQTLQGNANLGTIIKDMGYSGDMAKWAQLHPGLAQEQYAKKFGAGSASGRDIGSFIGDVTRYADQGQASPAGQTSFLGVANAVPAPPQQQGAAVSAPYAPANAVAAEKTAGATGMPNLQTTAQPQTTLDKATTFIKALFPTGVGQLFYPKF